MKWKMSDKSLFALLLRSPWWISIAVFAGFALLARALLPPAYVWAGLFGGLPFLVIGVIAARPPGRAGSRHPAWPLSSACS